VALFLPINKKGAQRAPFLLMAEKEGLIAGSADDPAGYAASAAPSLSPSTVLLRNPSDGTESNQGLLEPGPYSTIQ